MGEGGDLMNPWACCWFIGGGLMRGGPPDPDACLCMLAYC